jgi:predicted enzyme related to lactoylglutathione lyase
MGRRTQYRPGTFSWVELETDEASAAAAFYRKVFGWETEDRPEAGGTSFVLDADVVAGLRPERGAPSGWLCHVSVESAEKHAARAEDLGGAVLERPADDNEAGLRAVIRDPAGAIFAVWEPRAHIGAARVNDPGCLSWNDLVTADPRGAERFYSELFGWEIQELTGAGGYRLVRNAGTSNGGVMPAGLVGNPPSHWLPYFNAGVLETTLARIDEAGGRVVAGPQQVPAGRFAVVLGPRGESFALFEGESDD